MKRYKTPEDRTRAEVARMPIQKGRELAKLSQEQMAEYLRIDPRTLRRYESGELPTPDTVMLEVTELAGRPLLLHEHYKTKYGISDEIIPPVEAVPLAVAVVNLLAELEKLEQLRVASRLLALARDGVIDPSEEKDFKTVMDKLDGVRRAVDLLRYCSKE